MPSKDVERRTVACKMAVRRLADGAWWVGSSVSTLQLSPSSRTDASSEKRVTLPALTMSANARDPSSAYVPPSRLPSTSGGIRKMETGVKQRGIITCCHGAYAGRAFFSCMSYTSSSIWARGRAASMSFFGADAGRDGAFAASMDLTHV